MGQCGIAHLHARARPQTRWPPHRRAPGPPPEAKPCLPLLEEIVYLQRHHARAEKRCAMEQAAYGLACDCLALHQLAELTPCLDEGMPRSGDVGRLLRRSGTDCRCNRQAPKLLDWTVKHGIK